MKLQYSFPRMHFILDIAKMVSGYLEIFFEDKNVQNTLYIVLGT